MILEGVIMRGWRGSLGMRACLQILQGDRGSAQILLGGQSSWLSQASGPRPSFHARECSRDIQSNLLSLRTEILPWVTACISFLDHPSKGLLTMPPSKQKKFPFTPCFSAVMGYSRSPTQRVRALCTEGWG